MSQLARICPCLTFNIDSLLSSSFHAYENFACQFIYTTINNLSQNYFFYLYKKMNALYI
jgi:hypothetical protein